jgi:hypothetical protein
MTELFFHLQHLSEQAANVLMRTIKRVISPSFRCTVEGIHKGLLSKERK